MRGSAFVVWLLLASASANAQGSGSAASDLRRAKALSGPQLMQMLPGKKLIYLRDENGTTYRGIEFEAFWTRPGADATARNAVRGSRSFHPPFKAYTAQYSSFGSGGSYRINGNMICVAEVRAKEGCRSVFQLSDGGLALATFEKPSVAAIRVRPQPSVDAATKPAVEKAGVGKPLKGAALYAALNDAYVEPVRSAGQANDSNWPGEIFQSDGYYVRVLNGTRRYGGYQFDGDILCVEGDEIERSCRYLVQSPDRTYSFVDISSRLETRVVIKPRRAVDIWDSSTKVIDYKGVRYVKVLGDDIKLGLFWRKLSYVPGSLLSIRYLTETFFENDTYIASRQETPFITGKWNVKQDKICVQEAGKINFSCRYLYVNSDWTLVLLVEDSGDRRHYALRPARR
jgi:hypothetical protein